MKVLAFLLALSFLLAVPGWAGVNLNGDADSLNFTSTPITGAVSYAVSFWILTGTSSAVELLYSQRGGGGGYQNTIRSQLTINGTPYIESYGTASYDYQITSSCGEIDDSAWHHILFYRDISGAGSAYLYVDGASCGSDASTTANIAANTSGFGYNFRDGGNAYSGEVTELAVWSGSFPNAAQIELLKSSKVKGIPMQINPATLVLYLPLDDYSAGTALGSLTFRDLSSTGNNATDTDADGDSLTSAETLLSYPLGAISQ